MSINTYTFLCPGLFLVLAGCTQSPAVSSARDAAFSHSLKPAVPADIWQRSPEVTREGRYTLVSVKSADAQREPLNQLIDITMPVSLVNSVGDGFRYLLFQSGYSLCGRYGADFAELLNRPLPAIQRRLGPVRLSEALQVVAGPAWRMTVDEVNREVCFVLRDAYLAQARPASSPVTAAPAVAPAVSASAAGASSAGVQTRQSETLPLPAVPVLTASGTGGKGTVKIPSVSPSSSTATVNQMATTGGHAAASPSLTPATTDNKSSSAAVAASATSQATPSPAVAATGRNPFSGKDLTGKTTATTSVVSTASPSPVAPTASSPGPALSTPAPKLIGTPVKALPSGPEWKAAAGTTLQESLTAWAEKADCPNGGHWVVIWQAPVDYRIEAPLTFRGSFESALDQVFDLYRPAEKRLYAEANRVQCLVSVTGRPVDR
ncbi:TcpQ domain-containing protein [Salmonella enterica]|nr:TcpQ domain-containing protein [Salmonella enterica]EJJ4081422.1 TcpQ domain-containing protein [Salmonella enterica]